jgi:hypothetical protein
MRPHEPGVTHGKKSQGEESNYEAPQRDRLAYQGSEGEEETDEPGMLVESPQVEGEATGSNAFI